MALLKGNLFIPGPAGRIEAILKEPRHAQPTMLAIVSHPLPTGGGTMHNKLVYRMAKALGELGAVTLRYNFRGVGRSDGQFDEGRGEQDDLRTVIEFATAKYPGLPLVLGGFSFGAWVSLNAAMREPRLRAMVLTGLPVGMYSFDFVSRLQAPLLVVQGTRDQYGPIAEVRELIGRLDPRSRLVEIEGGDHFLDNRMDELASAIKQHLPALAAHTTSASNEEEKTAAR